MPEGHTIHRAARLQSRHFVGEKLRVSSPQGRFAVGSSILDGHSLIRIEPRGKHLFYHWSHGPLLHVHLGLFGKFRRFLSDPPPPTPMTRLAMVSDAATLYLSGPTACDVITPIDRELILGRLGPDPLARVDTEKALSHVASLLARRSAPVSAALLDQRVVAGLGNVYRAELLFMGGIHPLRRASEIEYDELAVLWELARVELRRGARSGRIITVPPDMVGRSRRSDQKSGERLFVYKREGRPCRVCSTEIEVGVSANRKVWWCPRCQAR